MNRIRKGLGYHWEEIRSRLLHPSNTPRKFLNFLYVYLESRFSPFSRSFGMPYVSNIDPASACNLECPLCPTGMGIPTLSKGMMKFETFEHVLNQAAPYLYDLRLYKWGEPLYNKDVFRMIRLAKAKNVRVELSTNLNIFREGMAADLVESGLDEMVIGLDGTDQEAYAKYRVGGKIDRLLANVKAIREERDRRGASTPRLVWQFLVMKQNQHQVDEARARMAEWGFDEIRVTWMRVNFYKELTVPLDQLLKEDREWVPTLTEYTKYDLEAMDSKIERGRCLQPWYRLVIGWNGKTYPCCNMYDEDLNFGQSEGADLKGLLNNAKFRASRAYLRRWFPTKGRDTFCSKCQIYANNRAIAKTDEKAKPVLAVTEPA